MKATRVRFAIRGLVAACFRGAGPAAAVLLLFCPGVLPAAMTPEEFKTRFAAFDGTVYTRFKIDAPADFQYFMAISAEIQPYGANFAKVGRFGADSNSLPRQDGAGHPPGPDAALPAKQYSEWIRLPTSGNPQWNVTFVVQPADGHALQPGMRVHLEFAMRPGPDTVFYAADEELSTAGEAGILMPCGGGLDELNRLMTFSEWARKRLELARSATAKMGPPPHLRKIEVATGVDVACTRWPAGLVNRDKLETELRIMELLGINGLSQFIDTFQTGAISDALWAELAPRVGLLYHGFRGWGGPIDWHAFNERETLEETIRRVNDQDYSQRAAQCRNSLAWQQARFVNLGDEIGPAIDAGYLTVPILKTFFHRYLEAQGLRPAFFGQPSWAQVEALEDRAAIRKADAAPADIRRFYWTRRFANYYTAVSYREATAAVLRYFPAAEIVSVNLQAGPAQFGYLGNDNGMDKGNVDIFEFNDLGSCRGLQLEDWTTTSDFGVGQICFASDLIRAAVRKHGGATRGLLVGDWISPRLIAWLMQGCKHIELYSYGPVARIGPAWGDSAEVGEVADGTRLIGPFDAQIDAARLQTAKAAILIANTSDILQTRGLYFCPERQHFYIALKHGYLHTDFVSEQEILNDNILTNYTVLYITDPQVRTEVQTRIAAWVKKGGHLWAGVGAANWNEYNERSEVLNPVLGLKSREMEVTDKWPWGPGGGWWTSTIGKFNYGQVDTIKTDGKSFLPALELPVFGAKLKATVSSGEVLGRYGDGSPAIIYNAYGKGSALQVGSLVGEAYVRLHWPGGAVRPPPGKPLDAGKEAIALAAGFADHLHVAKALQASVPGLYTSLMEGPEGYVIFLVDAAMAELKNLEIRIPRAGKVRKVTSARNGELAFRMEEEDLVVVDPRVTYTEIIGVTR